MIEKKILEIGCNRLFFFNKIVNKFWVKMKMICYFKLKKIVMKINKKVLISNIIKNNNYI